jgi:RimJ/RimL family protein N-acetyltransferase
MKPIETKRLILREWKLEDLPFFAAINQDPKVMEYLLKPLRSCTKTGKI